MARSPESVQESDPSWWADPHTIAPTLIYFTLLGIVIVITVMTRFISRLCRPFRTAHLRRPLFPLQCQY